MNADTPPSSAELAHAGLCCPVCGYDLSGLTSEKCPECGRVLDWEKLSHPQIPWIHRRTRGRFRAFWTTVWYVVFQNKHFRREYVHPVSCKEAKRFQWVVILHAYSSCLIGTLLLLLHGKNWGIEAQALSSALGSIGPLTLIFTCALLFMVAMTGLPRDHFHTEDFDLERQNRGIALSYYACAPLAHLFWACLTVVAGILAAECFSVRIRGDVLGLVAFFLVLLGFGVYSYCLRSLANAALGGLNDWKLIYLLPLQWLLTAMGILVLLPLATFYVVLVIASVD